MLRRNPTHALVGGGGFLVGLGLAGTAYVYVFLVGLAAGAAAVAVAVLGWRLARRLVARFDRALPDRDYHPCGSCHRPIQGRNKYCSETCREIAAEDRMRRRVHAERMADYGEVPF